MLTHAIQLRWIHIMEGKTTKVASKFSVECNTSEDCDSGTCSPSKTCGECEQSLSTSDYLKFEFGQTHCQVV